MTAGETLNCASRHSNISKTAHLAPLRSRYNGKYLELEISGKKKVETMSGKKAKQQTRQA